MAKKPPFKLFLSSNRSISSGDKEKKKQMFLCLSFINEHFSLKKQLLLI